MVTESMNQVMQQIASLSSMERQALTEWLLKQNELDKAGQMNKRTEPFVIGDQNVVQANSPDPQRRREYEWLAQNRHKYAGQYLALNGDQLVSHGTNGREVLEQARRAGVALPLIVHLVEDEGTAYYGGW